MFRYKGYTYDLYIKPWKKGNKKYEALKWETGYRCTWKRILYKEYLEAKSKANVKF